MYCFFIIWILDGYKNLIKDFSEDNHYAPFISVIIASRNEAHNLPILLELLSQQTYPQDLFEIIVVNDRSSDDSDKVLQKYCTKINNLKIVTITNCPPIWAGKKWAIHNGIKNSSLKILF